MNITSGTRARALRIMKELFGEALNEEQVVDFPATFDKMLDGIIDVFIEDCLKSQPIGKLKASHGEVLVLTSEGFRIGSLDRHWGLQYDQGAPGKAIKWWYLPTRDKT